MHRLGPAALSFHPRTAAFSLRRKDSTSSLFRAYRPCICLLPRCLLCSPVPFQRRSWCPRRPARPPVSLHVLGWPGLWLISQVPPSGAGVTTEQASVCAAPSWPGGYLPADSTQAPISQVPARQPVSSSCVSRPFPCRTGLPTDTFVYINTWSLASCPQTAGRPQGA